LTVNYLPRQYCDVTPFDGPHTELAWMFLQSLSEGGDLDEGFSLLSDDFTCWSLFTRNSFDKATLRQSIDWRKQTLELNIELLGCVTEGDTVVVEGNAVGTTKDGVPYDSPFLCIFETRDGLIVSMREYSDTRAQARALPRSPSGGY
jgi:ketosteroid isomerase-like protein